jgi:branched-chain amino acid transport system permease protein
MPQCTTTTKLLTGLLLLGLVVTPHLPFMNSYLLYILDLIYISILVSLGLNILAGYAGQISIGHAAFYAIGAYTSAVLQAKLGWPFLLTMVLAAGFTAAVGYVVGLPAIRLQGLFLAMATLAFGRVIEEVLIIAEPLTHGGDGMPVPTATLGPLSLKPDTLAFYYLCFVLAVLMTWLAINIVNSRTGRAFIALRESEIAAQTSGIDLAKYKTIAFSISAFYTGMAGALYAQAVTFIAPDGFSIFLSIKFLAGIIIGGMGSILGSVLGAITLAVLPELFAKLPGEWGAPAIFYGAALILVIMFMPFGIAGWVNMMRYRLGLRRQQSTPERVAAPSPQTTTSGSR